MSVFRMYAVLIFNIALIALAIYTLLYYRFKNGIEERVNELDEKYSDDKLKNLLNGSGINNIPSLTIQSTNPEVVSANQCSSGLVRIGTTASDEQCILHCANSNAKAINVAEGDTYIYNNTSAGVGGYCYIGERPKCNIKTTIPLMTINSVVCHSKFPALFGGDVGSKIVACNNRQYTHADNVLWDYYYNEAVDPLTVELSDEDELLSSGEYRFRCKFNGLDEYGNYFTESPFNRFIPFQNWCANMIYGAHPDVKTNIETTGEITCDCGDFETTRVKHIIPENPSSQCSAYSYELKYNTDKQATLTIPYKCFNINSLITDVGKYVPCPPDKFTTYSGKLATFDITYGTELFTAHPLHQDLQGTYKSAQGIVLV